jgi:hypothetical protein
MTMMYLLPPGYVPGHGWHCLLLVQVVPTHRTYFTPPNYNRDHSLAMQRKSPTPFFSFGILVLLQPTFCNAQVGDMWELCPGVEHANCDAAMKARRDDCGLDDVPHEGGCGCSLSFINSYVK